MARKIYGTWDRGNNADMVYTHVLNRGGKGVRSPVDALEKSEKGGVMRKPYKTSIT